MEIKRQIQDNLKFTYGKGNTKKYLTIHQTGNYNQGANAQAHANLQTNLGIGHSWHWTVDDKEAIQSYEHDVKCWHTGDGTRGGNLNSIGIEICVNPDSNYVKAVENGARLAAKILLDENIPIKNMVQHYFWSKKDCPQEIRAAKQGITWTDFVEMVRKFMKIEANVKSSIKSQIDLVNQDKLYQVSVGAFADKANADKLIKDLQDKGFKPYFTLIDNPYKKTLKPISEIAKEVVNGTWGNGETRRERLEEAGYNYSEVQAEVNKLV